MLINAYVYVGGLDGGSDEPVVYTITLSTAIAVGDKVASLTMTAPAEGKAYLRKDSYLYFGTNYIEVAEEAVITGAATLVKIKPATSAIALSDTALTWELQIVPAAFSSLNKPIVGTTSELKSRGFGAIIVAVESPEPIYTLIMRGNNFVYGRALVGALDDLGDHAGFEVYLQAPFEKGHLYSVRHQPQQQLKLEKVFKLAGLPVLLAQ